MEIGVFKRMDQGPDSTVYFMLVNRVCNDEEGRAAAAQIVSVQFNHPTYPWLEITEVVSGAQWVVSSTGTFSDVIDPGSGKLYRLRQADLLQLAAQGKSVSNSSTANNSQRKLYRESSASLHEVFESGGEIFYRKSTDGGSSWNLTSQLADAAGDASSPCLTVADSYVMVVWQKGSGIKSIKLRRSTDGGTSWQPIQEIASQIECVSPGPLPTLSSYSGGAVFVSFEDQTSEGLSSFISTNYGANWTSIGGVPGSFISANMPSSAVYTTY
jgi:hypothetical protein